MPFPLKVTRFYSEVNLGDLICISASDICHRATHALMASIVLYILSKPKDIRDNVYMRISGKVYAGTKAREIRDSGKQRTGTTKLASTAYVHSEVKFILAGDSEISVDRLRKDIGDISKYLQKI